MPAPKGNQFALGNDGGRPTTYDPIYASKVAEYLKWCEENPIVIGSTKTVVGKDVTETEESQTAARLPSLAGFSRWVGVARTTFIAWAEAHEEFSTALNDLEQEQERQLIEFGRAGEGNPRFAQFMLSAKHDYREKTQQDISSGGKPITGIINVIAPNGNPDAQLQSDA